MTYAEDRAWSDRYLPILRQRIGPHLLKADAALGSGPAQSGGGGAAGRTVSE